MVLNIEPWVTAKKSTVGHVWIWCKILHSRSCLNMVQNITQSVTSEYYACGANWNGKEYLATYVSIFCLGPLGSVLQPFLVPKKCFPLVGEKWTSWIPYIGLASSSPSHIFAARLGSGQEFTFGCWLTKAPSPITYGLTPLPLHFLVNNRTPCPCSLLSLFGKPLPSLW